MANLATPKIQTSGEYQDLAQLAGISFEEGSTYTLQCYGEAIIRLGADGKGFRITEDEKVKYKCADSSAILYVKTEKDKLYGLDKACLINIALDD